MFENTPKSIFEAVEKIAATSSKNEKDALVKECMSLPLFERIVKYAYDPFLTYGLDDIPKPTANGTQSLAYPEVWAVIDGLAKRTLTGHEAQASVNQLLTELLDNASANLFWRIIKKDMRAGFSEGTLNRVKPGLIPDFPYMRCSLPPKSNIAKWDWSKGVFSQEKADGMFANVNLDAAGYLWITTRQGSPFPAGCMPNLESAIKGALKRGTQSHGELLVYQGGELLPREIGNGVLNSLLSGGSLESDQEVRFYAWDQIPLDAVKTKGKWTVIYRERIKDLAQQLLGKTPLVRVIPTRIVKSLAEAYAHFQELLMQGKEGTVVKSPDAIWEDKTSKDQVKLKLEVDVDLRVDDIVPGKNGTKNEGRAGTLACSTSDGLLKVEVTVKNEALRDELDSPAGKEWIGKIIAVRSNNVTKPSESNDLHSLFLPRMVEAAYRRDKTVADSLQDVLDQFDAAVRGETVPA